MINLLTGLLEPDAGTVRHRLQRGHGEPRSEAAVARPATTLIDALTGGGSDYVTINGERRHVIGYMKDFLFGPEQARTPIGKLSGGERGRLMLARALAAPSNLMVLDEPTNDLDIETLDLLQELLGEYQGTILIVSHDRDFLDRVATSVIAAEGEGAGSSMRADIPTWSPSAAMALLGPSVAPGWQGRKNGLSRSRIAHRRSASSASTKSARSSSCPTGSTPCASEIEASRQDLRGCRSRGPRSGGVRGDDGALRPGRAALEKAEDEWLAARDPSGGAGERAVDVSAYARVAHSAVGGGVLLVTSPVQQEYPLLAQKIGWPIRASRRAAAARRGRARRSCRSSLRLRGPA